VAPDLLVTAGHCVQNQKACNDNFWVFDFKMKDQKTMVQIFSPSQVYKCVEIISHTYSRTDDDYSLIRLDRAVTDRQPLQVRTEGKVSDTASLLLIGHPSGLPMKIADDAIILDNTMTSFFRANTDSFKGNSGSPVFDAETGIVEGILVRGAEDYVTYPAIEWDCNLAYLCKGKSCLGESVVRITNIPELSKVPTITNVNVINVKSTSASLSWSFKNNAIESIISVKEAPVFDTDCHLLQGEKVKKKEYEISGLTPNTEYVVTVCSLNALGKYSNPVQQNFRTMK